MVTRQPGPDPNPNAIIGIARCPYGSRRVLLYIPEFSLDSTVFHPLDLRLVLFQIMGEVKKRPIGGGLACGVQQS